MKTVDTQRFPAVTVTVQTPEPGPAPDFSVKENGLGADVTLGDPGAAAAIAVAIDTSNSMAGEKIRDAKAAAARFVQGLPAEDVLAVYGFGAKPYVGTAFPANPVTAATALNQLGTGGDPGTAIYGAVQMASEDLAKEHAAKRIADRPLRRRVPERHRDARGRDRRGQGRRRDRLRGLDRRQRDGASRSCAS